MKSIFKSPQKLFVVTFLTALLLLICSGAIAQPPIVHKVPQQIIIQSNSIMCRSTGNVENGGAAANAMYLALTGNRPPMFNYSVSGKTIAQLIADFPTVVAPYLRSGDIVVMNEITNSLQSIQNVDSVYNQIIRYRNLVWAKGAYIVVTTCPARGNGYANTEVDRLAINAMLLANSAQFDGVADTGGMAHYNSVAATANTTYYNADTVHFTTAGYTEWGQKIAETVQLLIVYQTPRGVKIYNLYDYEPLEQAA